MEIKKRFLEDGMEVSVKGRLDSYWADHLSGNLEEAVREGTHTIRLNLSEVTFLTSAGIRVLVKFYKQLKEIQGSLLVSNPSKTVKKVLEIAGLDRILLTDSSEPHTVASPAAESRQVEREGVNYEVFDGASDATLQCRVIGSPELLQGCRFGPEHCRTLSFPESSFALGLGAFGDSFEDCRGRFGEFLAVAGAAAYLPTDGTNVPDYLLSAGTSVSEMKVLYGLACDGPFAKLARFHTGKEFGPVTLARLVDDCLAIADAEAAGFIMVTESAGLTGAALRRSPALGGSEGAPFQHPNIREWLWFTPERVHAGAVALVVGVVSRGERASLRPLIRPLEDGSSSAGHVHAVAFSYQPLQRGWIDLRRTVSQLFETETVQGMLHLVNDDRPIVGSGQSEFLRGACWIGPIAAVNSEGS